MQARNSGRQTGKEDVFGFGTHNSLFHGQLLKDESGCSVLEQYNFTTKIGKKLIVY